MRLLLANPNTSQNVTDLIASVAMQYASPGTQIIAVTAKSGVPYIATRADAAVGCLSTLELMAEHATGCDVAVVAAFGDPGLGGARELLSIPVIGLAEAAMLTACMLGRNFSVVTFSAALVPWYRECVEYNGLASRFSGIHHVEGGFADISTVRHEKQELLVQLCDRAVREDGADVIILGGAPLAGLATEIGGKVSVPLVDGVGAAVRQAETLFALHPVKARAGSYKQPDAKQITGASAALASLFTDRT
jgi:allantoin racemase